MTIINSVITSGGSAPAYYIEKSVDANGVLISAGSSIINLTGVTNIGFGQLYAAYYQNSLLTTVNIPNVKKLSNNMSMSETFGYCSNLASANFNSLEIISGNSALTECFGFSGLTDYDLSKLTTTSGNYVFQFCFNSSKLTNAYLQSLKSISGTYPFQQAYQYISTLTNVYFPALKTVSNNNTFNKMLQGCTGVKVHFPSNMQSVIGSWNDVRNGFGGGSGCEALFDLPATVTLTGANSVSYERNPRDDTATSLAWRINTYDADGFVLDWTSCYTSGTTDPVVGDTIYSDAACTVAVTTIA